MPETSAAVLEPIGAPEQAQAAAVAGQAPAASATPPVVMRSITVRTGRLVIDLVIPNERFRHTTPRLAAFAEGQYPDLPRHACVNHVGFSFGDVIEDTSLPHLLEHLIISLQVREKAIGDPTFIGTTEWIDEAAGEARVEVGFKDDLVALRALKDATAFLNMAVLTCLA